MNIQAAKDTLESSRQNVNDVMYSIGYYDPNAFRVSFKKMTGLSRIEFYNKYSNKASVR